jgi:acetoin utilization deacetylase AcuC-like enzyme
MALAVASHRACAGHLTLPGHPERPQRLDAAVAGAALAGAVSLAVEVDEDRALAAVARVHAPELAARLREACRRGPGLFDSADNPISEGTFDAAVAAVAAALAAADAVLDGRHECAWVPVRPPGHHAMRDRAMGFCFFNNVAVAAEELLARGAGPVAIVDFDVHHGNGTQAHFWTRSDAFFLSLHHFPFYPGSGSAEEIGAGPGRGFTRNVPLAGGADDGVYEEALRMGLDDVLRAVQPRAWLVSAGFDAHVEDPLGGMAVTEAGYAAFGRLIRAAAGAAPVLAVLEGGYHPEALRRSVGAFLNGLQVTVTP